MVERRVGGTNKPTIEVTLVQAMTIAGWVTASSDPNADNVEFWVASDLVHGNTRLLRNHNEPKISTKI